MSKKNIIILGAGLAGLSAAYKLSDNKDFNITVIEKESEAGGLAKTIHLNEAKADFGSHRIYTEIPEIKKFFNDFCSDILLSVSRESHLYIKNKYLNFPPTPIDFIQKIGIEHAFLFALSKFTASVKGVFNLIDTSTYEGKMRHAFGNALFEFLLKPMTEKTWKISANELHPEVARLRIAANNFIKLIKSMFSSSDSSIAGLKTFHYPRGGMESIVRRLSNQTQHKGVKIILNSHVEKLYFPQPNQITVQFQKENDIQKLDCDILISTLPITSLLSMLLEILPDQKASQILNRFKFLSLRLIYFLLKQGQVSRDNWTYFPETDIIFHRAYESKNFDSGLAPFEHTILALEVSGYRGTTFWTQDTELLIKKVINDAEKISLFDSKKIVTQKSINIPYAYPVYTTDYQANLKIAFEYLSNFKNIITTGRQGLFHHNNADHSIFMGFEAADAVLENTGNPFSSWLPRIDKFKDFRIID